MSNPKAEKTDLLQPEDIVPGDVITTMWRWCLRNRWTFIPDLQGGEPFVDPRCAAAHCSPDITYKSAQNTLLAGVKRYPGGVVRISEVMRNRSDVPAE